MGFNVPSLREFQKLRRESRIGKYYKFEGTFPTLHSKIDKNIGTEKMTITVTLYAPEKLGEMALCGVCL
jgi:hypothetical protein